VEKPKPWGMKVGILGGLLVGALMWWSAYDPRLGLTQKPQLLLVPGAVGILVVSLRNRRRKVGPYDPETLERNKRGTL
jgi:hypothetical protein